MLAKIKSMLMIDTAAKQSSIANLNGEIIIKSKKYSVNSIDAQRLDITVGTADLYPKQKFVFELTLNGFDRQHPFVGVGLVERISGHRATAVYKIEGEAARRLLNTHLEKLDIGRASRALDKTPRRYSQ